MYLYIVSKLSCSSFATSEGVKNRLFLSIVFNYGVEFTMFINICQYRTYALYIILVHFTMLKRIVLGKL